jgi:hypothetical protein
MRGKGSMPSIHQSLQWKQFRSVKLYWPNWSVLSSLVSNLYCRRYWLALFAQNILLKADFQRFLVQNNKRPTFAGLVEDPRTVLSNMNTLLTMVLEKH